ncbi:uncharacterized protein LOC111497027 isoform X2 [Cucurbita maxima]|uniref:Uncharacterized protein LOC111497027 isoform X2 n=1 Tax=Cucurbita maxima TaxID=3661 RepID=A0A6J1KWF0_CUCMA|nr:uncharacterized protein LOC111497027 isoform X2 [Cucurbita maxima]
MFFVVYVDSEFCRYRRRAVGCGGRRPRRCDFRKVTESLGRRKPPSSLFKDSCLQSQTKHPSSFLTEPLRWKEEKGISHGYGYGYGRPISLTSSSPITSISPFQIPMALAFSSAPSFIHFPISISNSNILNAPSLPTTNNPRPSPAPSAKRRASLSVKCHGGDAEPDKEDPFETIDKLYKDIKNEHFAPFQPKSRKPNFVSNFIESLQKRIIFLVQPTNDGSTVGVKWRVGWHKPLMVWDNGVGIHFHQSYVGKLLISNLENLIGPVLRLAPKTLTYKFVGNRGIGVGCR